MKIKTILIIIVMLFSILGMYFTYHKVSNMLLNEKIKLMSDYKIVAENIMVANKIESDKLLSTKFKQLDREVKRYTRSTDLKVTEIGNIVTEVKQTVNKKQSSDHVYNKGDINDHEFINITNEKGIPESWAMHYNNRPTNRWKSGMYRKEYSTDIVITKNKNGDTEVIANTNMVIDKLGYRDKKIPVTVKSVNWVEEEVNDRSFMVNPNLSLGVNTTYDNTYPTLSLGLFSYGRTKKDIDYRFFNIGVGYNDEFVFGIDPVQYNFANHIPLINNLFGGIGFYTNEYFDLKVGIQVSNLF